MDSIPTPIVNKQEEAPTVEHGNLHPHAKPPGVPHGKPHGKDQQAPYDDYFVNPEYKQFSYNRPGPERLPGADFNKKVYEFDETKEIWHQSNYEERVKVEAEIMTTLEALKTSVRFMNEDTENI